MQQAPEEGLVASKGANDGTDVASGRDSRSAIGCLLLLCCMYLARDPKIETVGSCRGQGTFTGVEALTAAQQH